MKLIAIKPELQILEAIEGISEETKDSIQMKIDFTQKHKEQIVSINGKRVFHPIVKNQDIFYFLQKAPKYFEITDLTERKYYYPIRYAEIVFDLTAN